MMVSTKLRSLPYGLAAILAVSGDVPAQDYPINHDAEYFIQKSLHADQWADYDVAADRLLTEFRENSQRKGSQHYQRPDR